VFRNTEFPTSVSKTLELLLRLATGKMHDWRVTPLGSDGLQQSKRQRSQANGLNQASDSDRDTHHRRFTKPNTANEAGVGLGAPVARWRLPPATLTRQCAKDTTQLTNPSPMLESLNFTVHSTPV
jgi:hypothetical protein